MNAENLKINVFSFPVCRTCLQTENQLIPLYESKAAEMLRDCKFCEVSENDSFPNEICLTCLHMLEQCYSFKQLCEKSEATLRKNLEKRQNRKDIQLVVSKVGERISKEENSLDSNDLQEDLIRSFSIDTSKIDENVHDLSESEDFSLKDDLISFLEKPLPPPLPFQCKLCSQSYQEENDLNIHQAVHNADLTCPICDKKFTGRQSLKRHLKIHLTQKPHVCTICSKSFPESYALVKHMRHHSGIPREKKHFCGDCGQGFSEPYYLKVHMRKHTGERPLVCPNCQKSFADPRSYKTHVMIHTGDRPYKCSLCTKSFVQNANLTKHLRVHTGEKPFLCKICDKKFSQSSSLEKHMKTHLEHKVFTCDKCNLRYSDKTAFKQHSCL